MKNEDLPPQPRHLERTANHSGINVVCPWDLVAHPCLAADHPMSPAGRAVLEAQSLRKGDERIAARPPYVLGRVLINRDW